MKDLPYKVVTSKKVVEPARQWCEQRLGQRWEAIGYRDGKWCVFWAGTRASNPRTYEWFFEDERDAVLFALRWS